MAGLLRTSNWFALLGAALVPWLSPVPSAQAGLMRVNLSRPSVPGSATGSLPPKTLLHVTVTLRPRDPGALAAYARAVSTPASVAFHRYLTPSQFGHRFGASPAQIALVRSSLQARGLRPGPASTGQLSIPLRATVSQLEHGLSISLVKLSLPGRRTAVSASAAPALAAGAARLVQAIVGLDSQSAPRPLLIRPAAGQRGLAQPRLGHTVTGGPAPCAQASASASGQGAYTADQIASAYGFDGLYGAGDLGAGVTVAVYELEPDDPSDIAAYQSCYGTNASIANVPVDGGVGGGPGSGEAALDIENLIGLAPDAKLLVYQGPNSASSDPGSGPYDTFSEIINQDRARVISVSWGQCEPDLGATNAAAENTLFEQAAVQGQSIVAAGGDSGSEDCDADGRRFQTQLAVDDPASQPFVTGVGGTTLSSLGPRPSESVWNSASDLARSRLQPSSGGAGGGGISSLWAMPAGQREASSALNVLGAGRSGSQCGNPAGYCREVPDVSADADPVTGYLFYWNGRGLEAGQPSGWQAIGGTSAAVPVWTALLALSDASSACAGNPIGFADPALYRAAGQAYAADFNDVRTGDNDLTGTNGGRYTAGPGYDEASGLGTPNAAALAAGLCADTVRFANPGAQRSTERARLSLRLSASGGAGETVRFQARGLPPGLSVNAATGTITGQPTRIGTFSVSVTAQNGQGSSASLSFSWTIGGAPRIAGAVLTGLPSKRPRLAFTVTAGRGAPSFQQLTVGLPSELKLESTRQVQVTAPAGRPRFTTRLVHGGLEIDLRQPLAKLHLALAYPQLHAAGGRLAQARPRGRAASELSLRIVDVGAGTSQLRTQLEASP